jgi:hypothetical protein
MFTIRVDDSADGARIGDSLLLPIPLRRIKSDASGFLTCSPWNAAADPSGDLSGYTIVERPSRKEFFTNTNMNSKQKKI